MSPGGTTFCISGNHSITSGITPKSGDVLWGSPGSLIDGGLVATVGINGNGIDSVTVRDLEIEHINNASQIAAVANYAGTGWDIENNEVAFNATEGIQAGPQSVVRNNHVHDNGQLGITGYISNGAVVDSNEIDHNGSPQYVTFEGGGAKFYKGTGVIVSNNYVHDNDGTGIWLDTDVVSSTISGNTLTNNADSSNSNYGIEIELACNDKVTKNRVTGTSSETNAIMISSSHNTSVTGNTTSGTNDGITLWMDSSRTTQAICGAPAINNDVVNSNTVSLSAGVSHSTGVYVYRGVVAPTGVSFTGNVYHAPDCSTDHWQWYIATNANYVFTQWQSMQQDAAGSCGT
jgi:parallel beta-helix repeat protein